MSENLRKTIADLEFVSRIKCKKTKTCLLKYFAKNPKVFYGIKRDHTEHYKRSCTC